MATYKDINRADILSSLTDIDSINQSIKNIVFIRRGTIPGYPEFGSNVEGYLFEQLTTSVIVMLQNDIIHSIEVWEPRVYNVDVNVAKIPEFNSILVDISYVVISTNIEENLTIKIK